jgi:hypothetical protein
MRVGVARMKRLIRIVLLFACVIVALLGIAILHARRVQGIFSTADGGFTLELYLNGTGITKSSIGNQECTYIEGFLSVTITCGGQSMEFRINLDGSITQPGDFGDGFTLRKK